MFDNRKSFTSPGFFLARLFVLWDREPEANWKFVINSCLQLFIDFSPLVSLQNDIYFSGSS